MTEQQASAAPGGAPGAAPAGNTPGNTGSQSFVAARTRQMAETMQPAPGAQPAGDAQHDQAGEQRQQQQTPPPEPKKFKIGDAEYLESDVQAAIAERAEALVRKQGLPQSAEQFEVKTSASFQLPEGVGNFQFDMADPTLAAARKFALANNFTQEQFSGMLDLHVASKAGELLNQVRAREANLQLLGAAANSRVESIATWLSARAGKDGAAVGNFIRQYPSAPIVKAMETLIKQFSSQGGADFSQQHRVEEEQAGKIPGYDNMSFVERRVHQMAAMLNRTGYRGGGGRRGE